MDTLVRDGKVVAPEAVLEELHAKDDDLAAWVEEREDFIIQPTTRTLMLEARAILSDHPNLTKSGTGRSAADPFVIALASLKSVPLVTQERGGSKSKPRIPYVCDTRTIAHMQILEVIRNEAWVF
jgi:hypothetical protein